jgi:hypothetical protein
MWRTLLVVSTLGALSYPVTAAAEPPTQDAEPMHELAAETVAIEPGGVAQSYLVLPTGAELGTDLKLITADSLAGMPVKFSDLALFTARGRIAIGGRVDLSIDTTLLPKQPSFTDEKAWQSVAGTARVAIGDYHALVLGVGGGHLLDHGGEWIESTIALERRKPLTEYMSFDLRAGWDLIDLDAVESSAHVGELSFQVATHFHDPTGHIGGWLGVAYAVPVWSGGVDPTDGLAVDPQPRLDLHVGCVLVPVAEWDVYIDGAVIGRGDAQNPATRLPILDGGFSQRQVTLGLVRHFEKHHHRHDDDLDSAISAR